jgi:ABC-2 type transport system ATP-binding protein
MTEVILKAKELKKIYDKKTVVKSISFEVNKGEIFGILGPNGAGKTTTLEMIETMRPIDGGSVTVDGIDVASKPNDIKRIIGVQPQTAAFQDKQKVSEIIEMFAAAYGETVKPEQFLDDVQLGDKANSYVEQLSKLFFLDEPTTGLDPQARRNLWDLVLQVRERGVTVIMTTHYMEEAETLCDRVAIMDKGKIITIDTPRNLIQQLLKRGFKKKERVEQADLEDVFIDLTGKGLRD